MSQSRLVLLAADDPEGLARRAEELRDRIAKEADLADLAGEPDSSGEYRAALVAASTAELARGIDSLEGWLAQGPGPRLRVRGGAVLGRVGERPRIGFLFPGQGAPVARDVPTERIQLSIVEESIAGLRAIQELGIEADFGLGHSVGELTALHWAGALDEAAALELARRRGEVMTAHATEAGAMASIEADEETFQAIVGDAEVTVACFNSPKARVVSGATAAVEAVVERARAQEEPGP